MYEMLTLSSCQFFLQDNWDDDEEEKEKKAELKKKGTEMLMIFASFIIIFFYCMFIISLPFANCANEMKCFYSII